VRRLAISTALAVAVGVVLAPVGASAVDTSQLPPGDQQFTIDFGGGGREYLVHVPTGAQPGKRLPVVFNFHGGGSDAPTQKAYSQMDATADRHGFVVVYPQGVPPAPGQQSLRTWNAGKCCGPAKRTNADDVGFTGAGHVWPGTPIDVNGTPRGAVLGESTKVVDANELMWEFFAKHPLPKS